MLSKQYIAGFLDGEGYFGIMRKIDKRYGEPIVRHVLAIKVAQRTKDEFILKEIQKQFGGRIEYRKFAADKNQADAAALCFLSNPEVNRLLDGISEFLVVKKKQSDILYKFISLGKLKAGKNTDNGGKNKAKAELLEKRESLYKEIIKLNQVGRTCRD